jgi:hypothetical protein
MQWGEQEKRVLADAQALKQRGHEVRLICPPGARIGAEAVEARVPVKALPIGKLRPIGVKVLVEWLKANPCDVVHTHSSTDCWLAAFALLALGRRIPMVRTLHEPTSVNLATRWLYTRAVARIVVPDERELPGIPRQRIDVIDADVAKMERLYAQVRR